MAEARAGTIRDAATVGDQVQQITAKFGSRNKFAKALTEVAGKPINGSTIQRWAEGTGFVPAEYHPLVFEAAKRAGIDLTLDDFVAFPPDHPIRQSGPG